MRSRIPFPRTAWTLAAVAAALALFVALFDWNWLRGPVARYVGHGLGRQVTIDGDLRGEFALHPRLSADRVTIANAAWSSEPVMASADQVTLRIDLLSLLHGPVSLLELALVGPRLRLERDGEGRANWDFPGDPQMPDIDSLRIEAGALHLLDPVGGHDIVVNVASQDAGGGVLPVSFSGSGVLRRDRFAIRGSAATLLALENGGRPYRVNATITAGTTEVEFDGTIVPAHVETVDGRLALKGDDLARLYPLLPIPFPWSPPYRLQGRLTHRDGVWSLHDLAGKVGNSDLAGRLDVDGRTARLAVDADFVSESLDYKDLGGLVGIPPPRGSAPNRGRQREKAKATADERVLPAHPYDFHAWRTLDAKVRFRGRRFNTSVLPLDNLDAFIRLADGVLTLQPLDFGVGGGHVVASLALDGRREVIKTTGEATVRNVELKKIIPALKPPRGSAGKVGGHAAFTTTGNSVADMLANSNGDVALLSSGGDASELAIVLTNLDLAKAAELLFRGDSTSPIHCVVAHFAASEGVLQAKTLVADTDAEKILGHGSIDLRRERYDLELDARSKRPSLLALRGPIVIGGTLRHPDVHPATGPIVARMGAAVALGLLNPLAALLPLVEPGGATDANCRALVEAANQEVDARATEATPKRVRTASGN